MLTKMLEHYEMHHSMAAGSGDNMLVTLSRF